jgi:hypothetical protein
VTLKKKQADNRRAVMKTWNKVWEYRSTSRPACSAVLITEIVKNDSDTGVEAPASRALLHVLALRL